MPERIKFKGLDCTAGACLGCGLVLIVSDKEPDGTFATFHEDPMCPWYLGRCANAEPTGPCEATKDNVEFVDK